jgi:hypothetical protein
MKLHKYTEQQLRQAISDSSSMRQVLLKLNVAPYGGNYAVLRKAIKVFKLNIDHFTGQGWRKNKKFVPKRPIEEYLENKFPIQSNKLRKRLLKEGVFDYMCSDCGSKTWKKQPIPLELDHIDGNNNNNRLSNLRLLCPNCHALTPTYRGRNSKGLARD